MISESQSNDGCCSLSRLKKQDPEIYDTIIKEEERQKTHLEMIASENYVSPAVLETQATVLTNKYAEGYPGKRYYGGCRWVDNAENISRERMKKLFKCVHANLQPHAGTSANMAAYFAMLEPGDTILAMDLAHGGHLSHGSPVNFSGKLFNIASYGVRKSDHLIDMDNIAELAREHKPKLIIAGATAYPRHIDFPGFRQIADDTGALLMVDSAHFAGLVAGEAYPSPVPHAHIVTGTTHKTLRGPRGGFIITNDNEIAIAIDKTVFPGMQGGPLMHIIAAKAVALREALKPEFKIYAKKIVENARTLAGEFLKEGFSLVSGGTDSHLLLVDLSGWKLTGKDAEGMLENIGIVTNKNSVPFDERKPFYTSGIRLGTPALTTRGMGADEMREITRLISTVMYNPDDEAKHERARNRVAELTGQFPLFAW